MGLYIILKHLYPLGVSPPFLSFECSRVGRLGLTLTVKHCTRQRAPRPLQLNSHSSFGAQA